MANNDAKKNLDKNRPATCKRAYELHAAGMTFRAIEERICRSLGLEKPGNGTKALRAAREHEAREAAKKAEEGKASAAVA